MIKDNNPAIKVLITALFVSLGLGQLTRFPGLPPGVNLYVSDIIVFLLVSLYLFSSPPKLKFPSSNLPRSIILFFISLAFSLVLAVNQFSFTQLIISSLYLFRLICYFSLYWVFNKLNSNKLLFNGLKILIISTLVFGFAQYLLLPDTRFLASFGWDDHYYRLIGTLGDPSQTGLILLLGAILVYFTLKSKLWLILIIPSILLTYSRSTYLSLISVSLYTLLIKKKTKHLIVFLSLLFLGLLILPRPGGEGVNLTRTYSIFQRQQSWRQAITIAREKPIFGVGFNTLRYLKKDLNFLGEDWQTSHAGAGIDSSLLFVLATAGLVGLTTFLYLQKNYLKSASSLASASLIAILIHSLFQNSYFHPATMTWIWTVIFLKKKDAQGV